MSRQGHTDENGEDKTASPSDSGVNQETISGSGKKRFGLPAGAAVIITLAGLWGCLSIYSARAFTESPFFFAGRQLLWLVIGIIIFLAVSAVPFNVYKRFAAPMLYISIATLVFVLFCGTEINGMRGWFHFGGINFGQPSEFAKGPFLLYMCILATRHGTGDVKRIFQMGLLSSVFLLLLMLEPDFGSALIFFAGFVVVYWVSGGRRLYLLGGLLIFAACTLVFLSVNGYAMERIIGFLDPDANMSGSGWHIKQFQYTMAHGGMTGSTWGNALWSNAFLPFPYNDSLFASIVESTGFIGGVIVIGGFLVLAMSFYSISVKAPGILESNFIFAVGSLCVIQAMIHISVNSVMLPPTGVTLPILSYGGSSLFSTMFVFGMAFSAARKGQHDPA